jgi:glutaredoxin
MFCDQTKEFLSRHKIAFKERLVNRDHSALEELKQRGLMTTPVTLVAGEAVVGFDQAGLSKLLGIVSQNPVLPARSPARGSRAELRKIRAGSRPAERRAIPWKNPSKS